ncbi:spore germination protein [Marinicrinis sediminis]|uniref:Spore germination protein n=1 Tax=Marinicrinis sediminis TaxID=1652465 RepID=A0ABW5RDN1_9BACL
MRNRFKNVAAMLNQIRQSTDFITYSMTDEKKRMLISYYKSLVDKEMLSKYVFKKTKDMNLRSHHIRDLKELMERIPLSNMKLSNNPSEIEYHLLKGFAMIQLREGDDKCLLLNIASGQLGLRTENDTENEYSVVGPKIGFVENMDINLHLLRRVMNTTSLTIRDFVIGNQSQTRVALVFLDGVTNEQHVNTMTERLKNIRFDVVFDNSQLDQLMSDNSKSPFPQFLSTERIDRVVYTLVNGQVALLTDGSPYVITGPTTIFDFFISPEDYYLPWVVGSFFRMIRMFGVLFSFLATSVYTAVVTFHYEMLPQDMLGPIIFSRVNVPFPPVIEVLFLEITIELLREAGARLPTKVGQTLGIVGGIVIGQASVEAALTSNILLIIVALSALASFTTPIFKMSNTIRFLRFPFILMAAMWGGLGIVLAISFLLVHLMRLSSLGTPYMVPFYPLRVNNFADSFVRSPYSSLWKRPSFLRPKSSKRYNKQSAHKKRDIDE